MELTKLVNEDTEEKRNFVKRVFVSSIKHNYMSRFC